MKIEGPQRTGATSKTDKAKKTGGTSGASFSEILAEVDSVDAPAAPAGVGNVNLFLAMQAAEHATDQEQRRHAIVHADDLLNELEDLRLGLLLGTYTINQLRNLSQRLQGHRARINDPQLMALLDEIELRAAVELAKYE